VDRSGFTLALNCTVWATKLILFCRTWCKPHNIQVSQFSGRYPTIALLNTSEALLYFLITFYYYYYYHHHHHHLLYGGIFTYIPETNYVLREYSVAAKLLLLFMVLISLVSVLNLLYCTFPLVLSKVCVQCPIWLLSVVYYYYYYYCYYFLWHSGWVFMNVCVKQTKLLRHNIASVL